MADCYFEFRKAASHSWTEKKHRIHEIVENRVRHVNFKKCQQDCMRKPGETSKAWRERVLEFTCRAATKLVMAFQGMPREKQRQVLQALKRWEGGWMKAVEELDYQPQLGIEVWDDHMITQWSSELMKGVDEYYVCRRMDCLNVTTPVHWVKERNHEWYRCAACGEEYRPWKDTRTRWPPSTRSS